MSEVGGTTASGGGALASGGKQQQQQPRDQWSSRAAFYMPGIGAAVGFGKYCTQSFDYEPLSSLSRSLSYISSALLLLSLTFSPRP